MRSGRVQFLCVSPGRRAEAGFLEFLSPNHSFPLWKFRSSIAIAARSCLTDAWSPLLQKTTKISVESSSSASYRITSLWFGSTFLLQLWKTTTTIGTSSGLLLFVWPSLIAASTLSFYILPVHHFARGEYHKISDLSNVSY